MSVVYCSVGRAVSPNVYRQGTARRAMSVEILLTAAQLRENSHTKGLTVVPKRQTDTGRQTDRYTTSLPCSTCGIIGEKQTFSQYIDF